MKREPLLPGHVYHFFNRGNNRENIFREKRNYSYFLGLLEKDILPIAQVYAYCLMKNHFHLLIHIRQETELTEKQLTRPLQPFSNLFNAYAKGFNKAYSRTGSLFTEHPERKKIVDDSYFINTVKYIHLNPLEHGFTHDIEAYPWSSYRLYKNQITSIVSKDYVLEMFGGMENFIYLHHTS